MPTPQIFETPFTQDSLIAGMCQDRLLEFASRMWDALEPDRKFIPGWHLEAIADHLEAVTRGDIKRLIINMPPRHMKSLLVSALWPAWVWTKNPEKRFIFGSYREALAKRDSLKTRRVIESAAYQRLFGHIFKLSGDQNEKMRFENNKSGQRLAIGIGSGTGEGADIIVADDPHKTDQAESEVALEKAIEWWDGTASTRANDPNNFGRVIVMQRITEKDLSGHVLRAGGYEHLCLPAEYEGKKYHTSLGFEDKRTTVGELLWPERFNKEVIDLWKKDLGSHRAPGQLQQDPKAVEGGLFKRHWWKTYHEIPPLQFKVQIWDCAQKPGVSNDYSVCATWGISETGYYLLDLWREKVEMPQLEMACQTQAAKWNPNSIIIEDKASGISLIQTMKQTTRLPIRAYNPGQRDKVVRATGVTPTVESGRCHIPVNQPWVEDFIKEHERFPNVEHDDQVDTTSCFIECLKSPAPKPRARFL